MKPAQGFDLSQITSTIYRRKEVIIAIFIVVSTLSAYFALSLSDIYRSSTLILVTPQRLPANYVSSTVTLNVEQRVMGIVQQIQGRTVMEKIVQEFDLFRSPGSRATLEERAERLQKRINIQFNRNNTFTLSFDAESPQKAMAVTARLGSLFIEENLKAREQQASGTTSFINTEAARLRKELEEKEVQVNHYRGLHRYELPQQLDSNLRLLDQLRRELENGANRLSSLEERRAGLAKQISEAELIGIELDMIQNFDTSVAAPNRISIETRRKELEALLRRYSEKHPDVVRLKQEMQALEAEKLAHEPTIKKLAPAPIANPRFSLKETLEVQVKDLKREMDAVRAKNDEIRDQITTYQTRVDNTPLRANELTKITRDYDITLRKYQDLLGKALESELSENMEKNQKGEQFQIVDRANFPVRPVAPNRPRLLLLGVLLGLGGGLGAAFLLENLNSSFKRSEDFDGYTEVPLLAVLPTITTRGHIVAQRQARSMLILASVGALAVGMVFISLLGPSLLVF